VWKWPKMSSKLACQAKNITPYRFHPFMELLHRRDRNRETSTLETSFAPRFQTHVCIANPKKAQPLDQVDREQFNSNAAMIYLL
jgi:hypothetical protein